MEFRLIYRGPLPAASSGKGSSRIAEKHALRKEFHRQLRELWKQHPDLRQQSKDQYVVRITPANAEGWPRPGVTQIIPADVYLGDRTDARTWVEHIAESHTKFGYRFVPLVSKKGGVTCALDVLFLRRDNPGGLIASGGDIDNRIKVLLDGLRMPESITECDNAPPTEDENPFFCLLQDDNLITGLSVTTDCLLTPMDSEERLHDVNLIIRVTVVNPSAIFAGGRLV